MIIMSPLEEDEWVMAGRFTLEEYRLLGAAVDLAEELVADHYRFSEAFWLRDGRYELKTLADLAPTEVTDLALAQILKCYGPARAGLRPRQFFRVCLQDHRLAAARAEAGLDMGTLLCYVVAHELIHVVRFARHDQLFEAPAKARLAEEGRVHDLTGRLLAPLELKGWAAVLEFADPDRSGAALELTGQRRTLWS
jgi:hypothetical protein